MKKLVLILCLFTTPAMAQQDNLSAMAYLKTTIANCTAESASLFEQANKFAQEGIALKARVAELEKQREEKAKPSAK